MSGPLVPKPSLLRRRFRKAGSHPVISFLIPFLVVIIFRTALLIEVPPPQPAIQDEFSYLLAGETYASFRMTNPTPPLWQHFETIHELMQPTYMSKYPPMQGLWLALGQLIFGVPWVGVLLSMAIFCGLLPWAFRAWIPPDWALVGALLAAWKIGIMSYWTESYWGGGAAAVGGALVLGSVRRLSLASTPGMAAVFTLGCAILANSRPYEGLVLVVVCSGYLLSQWIRSGRLNVNLLRLAPAAGLVALPIVLMMGYYNYRVTGKVTEFPYRAFEKQYAVWTSFFWVPPGPEHVYRHNFIRFEWVDWDGMLRTYQRKHWFIAHLGNFINAVLFYFGPTFFYGGYLFIAFLFKGAKNRSILALLGFFYLGLSVMTDVMPHYTAPAAALVYLAAISALRASWFFVPLGIPLGRWVSYAALASFFIVTAASWTTTDNRFLFDKSHFVEKRKQVLSFLERQPGSQLVFVHHGPLHDMNEVWTFNQSDIDASRIVWADSMMPAENQTVLDYYGRTRTVWMLDDDAELTLRPYDQPTSPPVLMIKNPPLRPPIKP